jgi:hypothetical protein
MNAGIELQISHYALWYLSFYVLHWWFSFLHCTRLVVFLTVLHLFLSVVVTDFELFLNMCYQASHEIEFYYELWIRAPPPRAWTLCTGRFMAACRMVSSWLTNLHGIEVIISFLGFIVLWLSFSYRHLRFLRRCCRPVHPPLHTPMLHRE